MYATIINILHTNKYVQNASLRLRIIMKNIKVFNRVASKALNY